MLGDAGSAPAAICEASHASSVDGGGTLTARDVDTGIAEMEDDEDGEVVAEESLEPPGVGEASRHGETTPTHHERQAGRVGGAQAVDDDGGRAAHCGSAR